MYDKEMVKNYIAEERELLKKKFSDMKLTCYHKPTVVNIVLGETKIDDNVYLRQILKDCEYFGLYANIRYNIDKSVTNPVIYIGDDNLIINPEADVEGATENSDYIPSVARGIIDYLQYRDITVKDKNVLIIGRGKTMGSRLIAGFSKMSANVMIAHSRTSFCNLGSLESIADIIITATNKPKHYKSHYNNKNCILIDAGCCMDEDGKLCGNCSQEIYDNYNISIGVPGGVGPLARLALFKNIYTCLMSL